MLEFFITALLIAILCIVITDVLMAPGMILGWYEVLLINLAAKNRRWEWLTKPLGLCVYCLTGQVALWFYLIYHWNSYRPLWHVFFIATAIFITKTYNNLWNSAE